MSGKYATETLDVDEGGIARAAQILRDGGLVAVPTETVYGLAARADSDAAVARIYRAKGRPSFNPLIVHVASLEQARSLAEISPEAEQLAARYWPGPLTLVLAAPARCRVVGCRDRGGSTRWRCGCHRTRRCVCCSKAPACRSPRLPLIAAALSARPRPPMCWLRSTGGSMPCSMAGSVNGGSNRRLLRCAPMDR